MKYFEKISGDKIYLSPICKDDIEIYTKWINDVSITDNLGFSWQQIGIEKEKEALDSLVKDGYNFAIIRRKDSELLGNVSLMNIDHVSRNAEIGIFIGEKENHGKGYGSEAMRILLKYGFETLNLNNVLLRVYAFNKAAIACYEKVGFKKMGERRSSYFVRGEYHNQMFMDILAEEFLQTV